MKEAPLTEAGLSDPNGRFFRLSPLLMANGFQDVLDPNARVLVLLPGLAIFLAVTAFNLIGEGVGDALDPRHQGAVERSAFITSDQKRKLSPMPRPGTGGPTPAT